MTFVPPLVDPLSYYSSLDIYMNTSRHEGMPLSVLEAMACGLPVVAPKIGGIPEVISNEAEGILVDPPSLENFMNASLRLIDDPQLRCKLGQRASEKVRSLFSSSSMAKKYRDLYSDLLALDPCFRMHKTTEP